jgi:peptidoglycan DL-endopeptidase CwlO
MNNRFSRALVAVAVSTALVIGGSVVAPSWAAPNYPSAAEVAAAKRNVAAKKAMIARIEKIVQQLAVQADALGKVAEIKGEAFNQAQNAVDVMTAKVNSLQSQANAANAAANKAKTQLGQIAAQMFRDGSGGTSLNLFLNSGKASDLLYQLGAQEKVAQQSNTIYNRSLATEKFAQSLSDQLASAKAELATKAAAAKSLFVAAQQAANAVQAQVDANNKLNKTFYAQLAVLQNTSAELEKQREEGLAAEARQNAGTSKPIAPELYTVGDPDTAKVQIAINFAKANLGDAYVLGGMGPSVWDCSGITKASYAAAGIYIGTHSATNQFETLAAARKLVPLTEWQAGDLIWYTQSSDFNGDKYHVAIYLGGNMMLEAPNPARTVRIVPVRYGELFPYAGRPSA